MSSEVRTDTIFISHASADIEQATEIYERLKDRDYPVWMAVHEVKPGASYAEVIIKTLDAAKAVIVLLSENSIASNHVKREMSFARELNLPIYPVTFTELNKIKEVFGSDWKNWLDISELSQFSTPRDAARSLFQDLDLVFDLSSQKEDLDKQTELWIENTSTWLKTLIDIPDSQFDFVSFCNEMYQELGYQIDQLAENLNKEGKFIVGEFLYSCYWVFTSIRPDWVPDETEHQQMLKVNYLLPSASQFKFPEAMNSLAYQLLDNDINLFIYWVDEKYSFDEVLQRSMDVGARTPIDSGDDPDSKRTSNTLGYLIFSTGLKLFGIFYTAKGSPEKIEEAINWLKEFDTVMGERDLDYLEEICPTRSFTIWLPMIRLFSAFFEYKSGSIPNAKRSLGILGNSKQREFEDFVQSQSINMSLAEEHRDCWVELDQIMRELKGSG
jgi:hypothetical protein